MEVKKSPKADLEGKKSTWLLIGYVVVLAFMFVAFEWTQRDVKIDTSQAVADVVFEEEIIPITETPYKPPRFQLFSSYRKTFFNIHLFKNTSQYTLFYFI